MSRTVIYASIVLGLTVAPASQGVAVQNSGTSYFVCWSNLYTSKPFVDANEAVRLLNNVQESAASLDEARAQWQAFAETAEPSLVLGSALCDSYPTREHADNLRADLARGRSWNGVTRPVELIFESNAPQENSRTTETAVPTPAADMATQADAQDSERARIAAREAREAEWKAKLDKYEADKAAWEAKVAAQKAEEERQNAAHAAAQKAAARAKAEFERKQSAHSRLLTEHLKREREYHEARMRHSLCVNGNQAACAEIAGGKPASAEQVTDAGEASTDTDARTCVSRPVVSASDAFKGQTAAVVFNGCETPVDVRVCLLRTGGWNCGVKWGLQPQDRWTHTSFETQGEIFWDARVAGSNQPLASPGNP